MCHSQRLEQAIQAYQSGKDCEENFRLLDEYYRPKLLRIFARRGFPPETTEDITQTVALRVFKELARLRGNSFGEFAAWVNKIADSVRCDYLRQQGTQKRASPRISLDSRHDEHETPPPDIVDASPTANPLQVIMSKEQQEKVKAAIAKLPGQQRKCVQFRVYQGLSYAEIAIAMNISVEAVKSHLKEGMKKLRDLLRADGDSQ